MFGVKSEIQALLTTLMDKIINLIKINSKKLTAQNIGWFLAVAIIFVSGYFLRSYLSLISPLPFSPYDLYFKINLFTQPLVETLLNLDTFSAKVINYPTGYYLSLLSRQYLGSIYIIYILGSVVFYLLGKEISGKRLGGFLSFAGFALASENIIQYSGITYPSGICYCLIILSILFLIKYFKTNNDLYLITFFVSSILTITSYHTGAAAYMAIIFGILMSLIFCEKELDKKFLTSFIILALFYFVFLILSDSLQINIIANAFLNFNFSWKIIALIFVFLALAIFYTKFKNRIKWLKLEYLPFVGLAISAVLIFSGYNFFAPLLKLGANNFFSSATTLNNYLAQVLLLHIYFILLLSKLKIDSKNTTIIIIRGWIIGLMIIIFGLILEKYYARIFDYTFPLMFILFGWYWSEQKKFRKIIIVATLILLFISQLMILNDSFTMRRYYTQPEIDSTKNIIALNLRGFMVSDLRTAALFEYLGKRDVDFLGEDTIEYQSLFYNPKNIVNYEYDDNDHYFIISSAMKNILYSTNFETVPISSSTLEFYDQNYVKVYSDEFMSVYKIDDAPLE